MQGKERPKDPIVTCFHTCNLPLSLMAPAETGCCQAVLSNATADGRKYYGGKLQGLVMQSL